jgi:hypothetical protein
VTSTAVLMRPGLVLSQRFFDPITVPAQATRRESAQYITKRPKSEREAVDISNEECQARNEIFNPLIFAGNGNRYQFHLLILT